jgi:hypothetical protein
MRVTASLGRSKSRAHLADLVCVPARVLKRLNGGDDVYWSSEGPARGRDG